MDVGNDEGLASRIASEVVHCHERPQDASFKADLTEYEGTSARRFRVRDVISDHKNAQKWLAQAQEAATRLIQSEQNDQNEEARDAARAVLRDAEIVVGEAEIEAIVMTARLRYLRRDVKRHLEVIRDLFGPISHAPPGAFRRSYSRRNYARRGTGTASIASRKILLAL